MSGEDWYGEMDRDGLSNVTPTPTGPVEIAPGVIAGDFVNGAGLLGVRRTTARDAGSAPRGDPGKDPVGDAAPDYEWMRRLGDQSIAYEVKDGRISVFETPVGKTATDPGRYAAVRTAEFVPGQTSDQPPDWRRYTEPDEVPDQDLSSPVEQDLDAYRRAVGYLRRDPAAAGTLDSVSKFGVPVVMVPDANDRFDGVFSRGSPLGGVIYWDPTAGLLTTDHSPNPFTGQDPNPFERLGPQSSFQGLQSPALGLVHEFGHAASFFDKPSTYVDRTRGFLGNGWDDPEEYRNITEFETPLAKRLGEPTRTNHYGDIFRVSDPTAHWPGRDLD